MVPVTLSKKTAERVLASIPKKLQGYALVEHLADNPRAHRVELLHSAGPLNLPQTAATLNKYLNQHRLRVACCEPAVLIPNHLDKRTSACEWSLCRMSPSELHAPEKGVERPRLNDKHLKPRRAEIQELVRGGYPLAGAIEKTRHMGINAI